MTKLRNEVSRLQEEKHIKYPFKALHEVELDMHDLTVEIERTELVKKAIESLGRPK
jgi:hypothetical protein